MPRTLAALLAALIGLYGAVTVEAGQNWPKQIRRAKPSVVQFRAKVPPLVALMMGAPGFQCSGWYAKPDLVVSSAHCFRETELEMVGDVPGFEVVKLWPAEDLALLRVERLGEPLKVAYDVEVGEQLMSLGYRDSTYYAIPSYVVALETFFFSTWPKGTLTDEAPLRGMSGGPVIDSDGRVVGVVIGSGHPATESHEIGYISSIGLVKALLD